jgi:hypothetical protein
MTGAGDRRRSIYEERAADRDHTVVALADGRLGTLDEHGTVTPLPPCCDDPVRCERPECWVPLT